MAKIWIDGNPHKASVGKRLLNQIIELGVDISHKCGGKAQCTTCQVEFQTGQPIEFSVAEKLKLQESGLFVKGNRIRLSCQLEVLDGMNFNVLMPVKKSEWDDAGPDPKEQIEPEFVLSKLTKRNQ